MPEKTQQEATVASSPKSDHAGKTNTIYDVSAWQIFWRNVLAGMARGLGQLLIWFILFVLLANIFVSFVWPQVRPFVESYMDTLDNLNRMSESQQQLQQDIDPQDLNQILRQFSQ